MRGRLAALLAGAVLAASPAAAEVDLQFRNGKVDLRCSAAPLSEVLDRLSRVTGMKLVQQGIMPSMLLSLRLENRTPAEAVFGVLEGLGLNYAFTLDGTGSRVDTLILAGAAGPKASVASVTPPPPTAAQRYTPRRDTPPPAAGPDDSEDAGEEEAVEEPEAEEAEEPAEDAGGAAAAGPRGNILQAPAQPVFPSSPFAPRAPMFVPQPAEAEPPADKAPSIPPKQ